MTEMGNVISVIVVLGFAVIVFRKRLAPIFKNGTKTDKAENVEAASSDNAALPDKVSSNVYINVFCINAGEYLNVDGISAAIEVKLHRELELIYNKYVGEFIGIDVVAEGDLLLFLIRWHT